MSKPRAWLAGLLATVGMAIWYRKSLRPWMYRWGATPEEYARGLPGDDLVTVGATRTTRSITMVSQDDFDNLENGGKASGSWAFHLRQEGGDTRLIVRGSGGAAGCAIFDIPHFVMERKMLRGIRDRAEFLRRNYVHPKFRVTTDPTNRRVHHQSGTAAH